MERLARAIFGSILLVVVLGAGSWAQTTDQTSVGIASQVPVQQDHPPSQAAEASKKKEWVFPGSTWTVFGNISPTEDGNLLSASYAEQGVVLLQKGPFSFVPYGSLTSMFDTQGEDWNNRDSMHVGAKLIASFDQRIISGMVAVGSGYTFEHRRKTNSSAAAPVFSITDWLGWDHPKADRSSRWLTFPGSTWLSVGKISPVEKDNIIGTLYVTQGVMLAKLGSVSIGPFAEGTYSADTEGKDWNNRSIYGGGIKAYVPIGSDFLQVGVTYRTEERRLTEMKAPGVGFFVNFWKGWAPSVRQQ